MHMETWYTMSQTHAKFLSIPFPKGTSWTVPNCTWGPTRRQIIQVASECRLRDSATRPVGADLAVTFISVNCYSKWDNKNCMRYSWCKCTMELCDGKIIFWFSTPLLTVFLPFVTAAKFCSDILRESSIIIPGPFVSSEILYHACMNIVGFLSSNSRNMHYFALPTLDFIYHLIILSPFCSFHFCYLETSTDVICSVTYILILSEPL